jgi:hypothetical protein
MSTFLADSTGPLHSFASGSGLSDFHAWAQHQARPIQHFAQQGFTDDLEGLSSALMGISDQTVPVAVKEQKRILTTTVRHAKDILILSDGLSDADEPRAAGGVGSGVRGHTTEKFSDERLFDNWAWPNASPIGSGGLSYEALRNPKTDEGRQMTAALNKLPLYQGIAYRGMDLAPKDLEKFVAAKGYVLDLHSSASTDENIAAEFASQAHEIGLGRQMVVLETHGSARNILAKLPVDLQETKEVVLMAGTRYKFQSLSHAVSDKNYHYTKIVLQEVS